MHEIVVRMSLPASAVVLASALICGCGGAQNAEDALGNALKTNGIQREPVALFSGKVSIDGQPPPPNTSGVGTFVILWNAKNPPASGSQPRYAVCDESGAFEFTTYTKGDGVPPGSYIVCIAQLEAGAISEHKYRGPDRLKNLYNDPDQNKKTEEFVVELTPPGKMDYHFDLRVADKSANANPGPNAITSLRQ